MSHPGRQGYAGGPDPVSEECSEEQEHTGGDAVSTVPSRGEAHPIHLGSHTRSEAVWTGTETVCTQPLLSHDSQQLLYNLQADAAESTQGQGYSRFVHFL